MNIPKTKIWYSKKDRQTLQAIKSLDITDPERDLMILNLAGDMVKHAKQARSQTLSVYRFLVEA